MLVVDAAGSVAGQITFQGFRLSYPGGRVALDLTDQACDPHRHLPVCGQPVQEVLQAELAGVPGSREEPRADQLT